MIVCLILRGKMKSVRKGTHADAYVTGSLNLTASRDQYTHTTETRTKIEHESSDSGGGGSSACSGGWRCRPQRQLLSSKSQKEAGGQWSPCLSDFLPAPCRGNAPNTVEQHIMMGREGC